MCNGINNLPITFTVRQGGGKVNGADTATVNTGITGHAQVSLTLGPDGGQNVIEANYPGNPNLPATFIAYGVLRDPAKPTTFTGLVLDNTSNPIGGATCRLEVGGQSFTTTSDPQGRFAFEPSTLNPQLSTLPSGAAHLYVDGLTATQLNGAAVPPGTYPPLGYVTTIVPNAENSLPTPVLLPCMNVNNAKTYDGTTDLVLTCEGIAGLKMTIKAGSMRKPDGSLVTPTNTAVVSLNQVHHDQIPMPMPDGASPPFAWTLQPGGAHFDPPIAIEYPNMSGLPAGAIAYFLSFNHDTERFEIVASGHVTPDGSTILSDPGAGLTIAGWGCNCPPYSVTGKAKNCCRLAIALFSGGLEGEGDLKSIRRNLQSLYGEKVFVKPIEGNGLSEGAIDSAIEWLRETFADCPTRPKTLLIGYSLGGDTVSKSDRIEADARITIDPISREALADGVIYQRSQPPRAASAPILVNYLSGDLSLAERALCVIPIPTPLSVLCLRGYNIDGTTNIPIAGETHFSVVGSSQVWVGISATVSSLLASEAVAARIAPAPPAVEGSADFLDESWTLAAGGQSFTYTDDGSFTVRNVSAPDQFGPSGPGTAPDFVSDDYIRIIGTGTKNGTRRYAFSDFFKIRQAQTVTINNLTFTDTPPRKPDMLAAVPDQAILSGALGQTTQVRVTATFADKTTADVTPATSWTSYRTSNVAVAKVDANGLVTGTGRGIAYVTAVNEGATTVAQVTVVPGDSLTRVKGILRKPDGSPAVGAIVSILGAGFVRYRRCGWNLHIS